MILAAKDLIDLSPSADFLGAGLARVIDGNVVAGGLFLLASALVLHLLATKAGWWEAAPAVPRVAGVGLAVVIVGVVLGYPVGGADLRPVWALARLAAYAGIAGGILVLAARAVEARRARPGR